MPDARHAPLLQREQERAYGVSVRIGVELVSQGWLTTYDVFWDASALVWRVCGDFAGDAHGRDPVSEAHTRAINDTTGPRGAVLLSFIPFVLVIHRADNGA